MVKPARAEQAEQPAGPGYQQPYPAYPVYGYTAPRNRATNSLAIASLVCAIAGVATCGVSSVVGAILGHVARRQIRERGEDGDALALAGIITGWIITGLYVLLVIFYVVLFALLMPETYGEYGLHRLSTAITDGAW